MPKNKIMEISLKISEILDKEGLSGIEMINILESVKTAALISHIKWNLKH
jgi:hypothetical protein